MRARPARFVGLRLTLAAGALVAGGSATLVAGCSGEARSVPQPPTSPTPSASALPAGADPQQQLAARIAAAKDRRYIAAYSLTAVGRPARSVLVTVAADGTWRVDVQGGALGGTADVAIAGRPEGQYQCPVTTGTCVRVAAPRAMLPAAVDPRVQYPFTRWPELLIDRQAALSVALAPALPGATGTCYSIEPTSVAMQPAIESAVLCYTDDGLLSAARAGFGVLAIAGQPSAPPATVVLPGPVVQAAPLPTAAPPPPPSASAAPTTSRRP